MPHSFHTSVRAGESTRRLIQTGFGFAFVCLIIVGVVSYLAVNRLRGDAARVEHSQKVLDSLECIFAESTDAENGHRGFVVTGDESFLEPYLRAIETVPDHVQRLRDLTSDNSDQQTHAAALGQLIEQGFTFGRRVIEARRNDGFQAARAVMLTTEGKSLRAEIRNLIGAMRNIEGQLLQKRESLAARSANFARSVIIVGSIIAFAVVGLASIAMRRNFGGRMTAEQGLRRSEESLSITLNSIGDAVLATDTAGRITRMNPVAEKLTGWTRADALNRAIGDVFRIINEETRAPVPIPVDRVLETGELQGLANHTVLIARDGAECAIADSAAPIRDREGNIIGVVLVFRDVSKERAAEIKLAAALAELARERTRLKFIFDSVPVGISFVVIQPDGHRMRLINEAHLRICGLTESEAEEPDAFTEITHPEDREKQAILIRQLYTGQIDQFSLDKRYVRADGQIVWVMLFLRRKKQDDGSYEELSIVVDITERKEAVAQLERFFSLSLDFLCISSADGYFKRVSAAVKDILGWEIDEFLATPYLEMVHPEDQEATKREVTRQILAGERVLQFENRYRHKNGSWRVLSWRSVPQSDGLMYATARDVTERNRTESEILRLNSELQLHAARLEAANKELETFSYSVSHDLRAPLRHIQGYVAMLVREVDDSLSDKARRYLKTITDAGRDMSRLIDDLLSFSKMGRADMRETAIDPNGLIEAVRKNLELVTEGRNIRWTLHPLPQTRGDAAMLKQVFANLVGNAVKYTRGRDPAEIEVGCAGEEDGRPILFVRDNGAGFDMKYAGNLFGVFQRLHRQDEFEGTGIGLANARRIITRHGCRIWAEAALNVGATFYFTVPRATGGGSASPYLLKKL